MASMPCCCSALQDKGFGMRKNNRSKIFHHSMTNPRRRPVSNISTVSDEPRCVY